MKIIETKNLFKTYGKKETKFNALNDINLSIEEKQFVAIIGASGSGKSTLLHVLGTVDRPTSGSIIINNEDVVKKKEEALAKFRRDNIGFIFQSFYLMPILTVEENISTPFLLKGEPVNKERLDKTLSILGLEEKRKCLPNQLSGGQQQRVAIGRAMIHNPKIVFADEPTGNLDSKNTEEVMNLLKSSAKENGQTLIVVTHDLNIASYADRVIEMEDGKIKREGYNDK